MVRDEQDNKFYPVWPSPGWSGHQATKPQMQSTTQWKSCIKRPIKTSGNGRTLEEKMSRWKLRHKWRSLQRRWQYQQRKTRSRARQVPLLPAHPLVLEAEPQYHYLATCSRHDLQDRWWALTRPDIEPMERPQRKVPKQLQALQDSTASAALHLLTGVLPVNAVTCDCYISGHWHTIDRLWATQRVWSTQSRKDS